MEVDLNAFYEYEVISSMKMYYEYLHLMDGQQRTSHTRTSCMRLKRQWNKAKPKTT